MEPSSDHGSLGGWIVSRLGGGPAAALGLDLAREEDRGRWWVAACLLSGRVDEARARAAFRALDARGLAGPAALAGAAPDQVARVLEQSGLPRPEAAAALLGRSCRALMERHEGSFAALAGACDGLDELGGRLAGLARGVGTSTVTRFLRALRAVWPAASDLPLSPAAEAAARHLGLAWDGDADVEAALERLGRAACLRERPERCPLEDECPLRISS